MNEQTVRNVVLVRAIESADSKHQVLSEEDRTYASRSANELAQWDAADKDVELTPALFLQKRAEQILKKIEERSPAFGKFTASRNWLLVVGVALPVVAFLSGIFLDRIADPHRVDLLSPPLLLIILWNLVVYAALVLGSLKPASRAPRVDKGLLGRLANFKAFRPRRLPQALAVALSKFVTEWAAISAPLTSARVKRIVHLSSACFAVGTVISLYVRGFGSEFQPGWESTYSWVTPDRVHAILSTLFTPATVVFQLPGFSVADVKSLRLPHTAALGGGEQWVYLYVGTLILLVVLPRLGLALAARWRECNLADYLPLDLGQPYFRKLTEKIGDSLPAVIRVVPYSFTLDETRDRGLTAVARLVLGERARVMLRPSTPYGEDSQDAAAGTISDRTDIAHTVALFNLSATPERENHGVFLNHFLTAGTREFSAMIDESGYLERVGSLAGGEVRMRERIALWRQFCDLHNVPSVIVNLISPNTRAGDIENGLVSSLQAK